MSGPPSSRRRAPGRYRYTVIGLGGSLRILAQASSSGARISPTSASRCRWAARSSPRPPRAPAAPMPRLSTNWAALLLATRRGRESAADAAIAQGAGARSRARQPRAALRGPRVAPSRASLEICRGSQARRLQQLVRTVSALGRAASPDGTAPSGTSRRGCPTWPRWASTCCTFRPSTRSAASTARAPTTRSPRGPSDVGSPWAIGSAEGGHKEILPELGTLEDFRRLIARGARARHRDRARHRLSVRARPPLRERASASGSSTAPTAACNTPRIRRRSTRTSIRSISRPTTGARCGRSSRASSSSGSSRACGSFASTIRTPSRFAFWEWLIGEIKREQPGRDLPGRGVHPAEGHAPPGEARLHPVVHLFHLAQHQARADRVFHRADAADPGGEYFRPNVWPNTPDILHETLQSGLRAVFAARLVLAATLSRQLRHLRPDLRADGKHAARTGQRGVSGLGEVPAAPLGPRSARQPAAL